MGRHAVIAGARGERLSSRSTFRSQSGRPSSRRGTPPGPPHPPPRPGPGGFRMASVARPLTLADVALPRSNALTDTLLVIAASLVTAAAAQIEIRLPWTPVTSEAVSAFERGSATSNALTDTLLVIAASLVTAAAAQIEIRLPWTPVPITG